VARGSLRKRGQTWTYVIYLGRDETGKKRQKAVGGFRTKKLAEAAMGEALERMRTGLWTDPGIQTVAEFLHVWLAAVKPSLRATTAASYEDIIDGWLVPRVGSLRLTALTPARIGAVYGDLLSSGRRDGRGGLSSRSVRYAAGILKHALGDAVTWGLLPRNPAALVDPPRQQQREMKVWDAEQVREFFETVADDRLYVMWVLLALTGLRRGEVLGLQWPDVDAPRRTLAVRRALVSVGYEVQLSEPKTARGTRMVGIDPISAAALEVWRGQQAAEREAAGELWQGGNWVFTDEIGRSIHPQRASVMFRNVIKKADLSPIRLHDLRHTAATLALTAGVHPKVVAVRLGHSAVSMTLDTYSHVLPEMQSDAADKVADLIYPKPPSEPPSLQAG
jgi:integrase